MKCVSLSVCLNRYPFAAYFGLWGSFFNGSFLLGTWMRENKKIAFIVREDHHNDDEDDDDEDAAMNAAFDYDYN